MYMRDYSCQVRHIAISPSNQESCWQKNRRPVNLNSLSSIYLQYLLRLGFERERGKLIFINTITNH